MDENKLNCSKIYKDVDLYKFDRLEKQTLYTKDREEYKFQKVLGKGTFGSVELYESEKGEEVVVKKTKDRIEYNMVDKINNLNCNIIKAKSINFNLNSQLYFIVMQPMNGELTTIIPYIHSTYSPLQKLSLVFKLLEPLICLRDAGYCFTDLKSENIMYRCNDLNKDTFDLVLIDYGSICPDNQLDLCTQTDPPYGVEKKDSYFCVASGIWNCVWLLIQLFVGNEIFMQLIQTTKNADKYYLLNIEQKLSGSMPDKIKFFVMKTLFNIANVTTYNMFELELFSLMDEYIRM